MKRQRGAEVHGIIALPEHFLCLNEHPYTCLQFSFDVISAQLKA